jgi:hypothetical protein
MAEERFEYGDEYGGGYSDGGAGEYDEVGAAHLQQRPAAVAEYGDGEYSDGGTPLLFEALDDMRPQLQAKLERRGAEGDERSLWPDGDERAPGVAAAGGRRRRQPQQSQQQAEDDDAMQEEEERLDAAELAMYGDADAKEAWLDRPVQRVAPSATTNEVVLAVKTAVLGFGEAARLEMLARTLSQLEEDTDLGAEAAGGAAARALAELRRGGEAAVLKCAFDEMRSLTIGGRRGLGASGGATAGAACGAKDHGKLNRARMDASIPALLRLSIDFGQFDCFFRRLNQGRDADLDFCEFRRAFAQDDARDAAARAQLRRVCVTLRDLWVAFEGGESLDAAFAALDANHSGDASVAEFVGFLRGVQDRQLQQQQQQQQSPAGADSSGQQQQQQQQQLDKADMYLIMSTLDRDGDGDVDVDEIHKFLFRVWRTRLGHLSEQVAELQEQQELLLAEAAEAEEEEEEEQAARRRRRGANHPSTAAAAAAARQQRELAVAAAVRTRAELRRLEAERGRLRTVISDNFPKHFRDRVAAEQQQQQQQQRAPPTAFDSLVDAIEQMDLDAAAAGFDATEESAAYAASAAPSSPGYGSRRAARTPPVAAATLGATAGGGGWEGTAATTAGSFGASTTMRAARGELSSTAGAATGRAATSRLATTSIDATDWWSGVEVDGADPVAPPLGRSRSPGRLSRRGPSETRRRMAAKQQQQQQQQQRRRRCGAENVQSQPTADWSAARSVKHGRASRGCGDDSDEDGFGAADRRTAGLVVGNSSSAAAAARTAPAKQRKAKKASRDGRLSPEERAVAAKIAELERQQRRTLQAAKQLQEEEDELDAQLGAGGGARPAPAHRKQAWGSGTGGSSGTGKTRRARARDGAMEARREEGRATRPARVRVFERSEEKRQRARQERDFQRRLDEVEAEEEEAVKRLRRSTGRAPKNLLRREEEARQRKSKLAEDMRAIEEEDRDRHRFRARPVNAAAPPHARGANAFDGSEMAEEMRKQRIARRADDLMRSAELPPRMKLWEEINKSKQGGGGGGGRGARGTGRGGEQRRGGARSFRAKRAPNFAQLQKQWDNTLHNARGQAKATVPEPFMLCSKERLAAEEQHRRARQDKQEAKAQRAAEERAAAEAARRERLMSSGPQGPPAMTRSMELKVGVVQARREQEAQCEAAAAAELAELHAKWREAGVHVGKELEQGDRERRAKCPGFVELPAGDAMSAAARQRAAAARREFKQALAKAKARVAAARAAAPSLLQRHEDAMALEEAKRKAVTAIAKALYGGADFEAQQAAMEADEYADELFDEDERVLMGGLG